MLMKKVFIVGAGQMGLDIGQVFAKAGIEVVFRDMTSEILANAMIKLTTGLNKLVAKEKMDEAEKAIILAKISTTIELAPAADADLVIEAIIENADVKKKLFANLDAICKPETILASNTSSISITEIAAATKRPDKFIGMHFFNPATVMKLVEVIRGLNTSDETFKTIYDLSKKIGKEPIKVKEGPGFVVNRILVTMINEAIIVAEEGLASVEDIDKAMKLGCNHPMGPLALADLIGLDTCLHIMDVYYAETGDSKYRAARLLRQMVRGGKLGRKSNVGFYDYTK
nr:3-hydroxybutyryl-CoA dehydrogenase [Sporomusa sp. KB1]